VIWISASPGDPLAKFDYLAFFDEVDRLRRPARDAGKEGARPAIDMLLRRLRGAVAQDETVAILEMLGLEYGYEFDNVGKEWAMRKRIDLEPRHFYPYTALAEFLWYSQADMTEALDLGCEASNFRRKAEPFRSMRSTCWRGSRERPGTGRCSGGAWHV